MKMTSATDNRTTELHEVCGDDKFDLIAKAREKLLDSTNIESRPEEVAVLDNILFRCWQMGWLDQLRDNAATLGSGTCEWTLKEVWPNRSGDDHVYGYETSCGARHTWWPDSLPNFCPTCGKAVKR